MKLLSSTATSQKVLTLVLLIAGGCGLMYFSMFEPGQAESQDIPTIKVPLNGVKDVSLRTGIERVVTGDSGTVRVRVINSRDMILFGMQRGVTTLHVWTERGIVRYFLNVQEVARPGMKQDTKNILQKIQKAGDGGQELRVITPQYRTVSDMEQYIQRLLRGDGEILLSDPTAEKIFVVGKPGLLNKIEQLLQQVDVPGQDVTYTRRIALEHRPVKEVQDKVKGILSEAGKVIIDEETNSLLVVDQVSKVKQVAQFLDEIDVRTVSQVRIEAKFVEMTEEATEQFGINWSTIAGDVSAGANLGPVDATLQPPSGRNPGASSASNELQLDLLDAPDLDATIDLLESKDLLNLISSPNVMTRNQQEAVLEIVNEQTYVSGWNVSQTQGGSLNITPIIDSVTGGITLTVTPLIGQSDVIQLDVEPILKIVDLGDAIIQTAGEGENEFPFFTPEVDRRKATLNVAIRDGKTLVIGGLSRQEENKRREQAPVLGDIPILGYLFRSRNDEEEDREITIFLTADIVRLREQGDVNQKANQSDTQARTVIESSTQQPAVPEGAPVTP